jgi:hypothetical protein
MREWGRGFFYRNAMRRHLASIRLVIGFTFASCAAQKARLTAAVRILGKRFVTGATGKAGLKANATGIPGAKYP